MKQRMLALRRAGGRLFGLAWLTAGILVLGSEAVAPSQSSKPEHLRVASEFAMLGLPVQPSTQDFLRIRVFQEPLVPLGEPTADENTALATALAGYSTRQGPDDFSSLTHFLDQYPRSHWAAALLTDLGLEYYNTGHYSLALDAWQRAWNLAKDATDPKGKAIADRAAGELAYMYSRVGRRTDLEAFFKSVEGRVFIGSATERIVGAREALANMQERTETAFRCGPLALLRIQQLFDPQHVQMELVRNSTSTPKGCSLSYVAELSRKMGLHYQMAFRQPEGDFIVPSVVHWKVGHYAALTRREGDNYFLEDSTFATTVWASRQALDEEASGYCLIPSGPVPKGWRTVDSQEGGVVWGKGPVPSANAAQTGCNDQKAKGGKGCKPPCQGMAVSDVHLAVVSLNLVDEPVGYSPPVGPDIKFTVRYSQRDAFQPTTFAYANFGPKWTCDWIAYIIDNPSNNLTDVSFYARGGGTRTFASFDTNSQTYAFQQYDQTQLRRTGPATYEMVWPDGSKFVFAQSDGSAGTSRKIFLTQVIDPFGNAAVLGYDSNLRVMTITDAIGQVTTLTYGAAGDLYKITRVTDPFGRFATFAYDELGRLTNITDVIGLSSQFSYQTNGDFINALITPYGTTTFTASDSPRRLDIVYPDGSSERVEFEGSSSPGVADAEPAVPLGMSTYNSFLGARNTVYWDRTASAMASGDYTKARIYHWLHTSDLSFASGILESSKEPLEGRVWYNYLGQGAPYAVGSSSLPTHVGRVLDDGATQLYTYAYNGFGKMTKSVDPMGRTFSYIYATNGIDLLEVRMTRSGKNELLQSSTYNSQHLPLTTTTTSGQTSHYTYNSRGQMLTYSNPKNETTTFNYNSNGYLTSIDGPLPGTNDVATRTYDGFGRIRTRTDVNGYSLTYDYDALDRMTRVTYPDSTFIRFTYDRLDPSVLQDRAGRQTLLKHDAMRQLTNRTDALGRVTLYEWCSCGGIKSLIDPMGRTTSWRTDVQERLVSKVYGDGSVQQYFYEKNTSRLRQFVDEKNQSSQFTFNPDNSLRSIAYANAIAATPPVIYTYDPEYQRTTSMTDGSGTTTYGYSPINSSPSLGAGLLASVAGPLANDTINYSYDELGRIISTSFNGIAEVKTFDEAGRVVGCTNALGVFSYSYDGPSTRVLSAAFPNSQTTARHYGDTVQDLRLDRITYQIGANPISDFRYTYDNPARRILTWSQQGGTAPADLFTFAYDLENQLLSVTVTNSGSLIHSYGYSYDHDGNRLVEQIDSSSYKADYNALNQINTSTAPGSSRTNEFDAQRRLVAVTSGNLRTEFFYDGLSRLIGLRQLSNGSQISWRRFVWNARAIAEERDEAGNLTKRFFRDGVQLATGPNAGNYFYTRDHLGSIRELTDGKGAVRARYTYDPFGRRTKVSGDLAADFGFAEMFYASEAGLDMARFRAYDPPTSRWLSRDPLRTSEWEEGANLYTYVANNPVSLIDPLGLERERMFTHGIWVYPCCLEKRKAITAALNSASVAEREAVNKCFEARYLEPEVADAVCEKYQGRFEVIYNSYEDILREADEDYRECLAKNKCVVPCHGIPFTPIEPQPN